MKKSIAVLVAALMCAPALAARADALSQVRAQIDAANARFAPAVFGRNAAMIAGDYLKDGVFVPPAGAPIRGRDAIRAFYAASFAKMHGGLVSIKCATKSLQYDGTAALEQGTCTFVSRKTGGKLATRAGKYLTVWRKDADGRWRIAVNLA